MAGNPSSARKVKPRPTGILWFLALLLATLALMVLYFVLYRSSRMPGPGLRYLWIPPLVLVWLLISAARYIQRVYHLEYLSSAFQYLFASMFGLGYPVTIIQENQPVPEEGLPVEENLIASIGGPGYLLVHQGQVVLLEDYRGGGRVVGPGRHYISNTEIVKEKLSLEERRDRIEKITTSSRDGIEMVVRDVNFRYRLCTDQDMDAATGRTPENPYPYSEAAVVAMGYNRNFGADGLASWHAGIIQTVEGVITDYIRSHPIDHLTAPGQVGQDPRRAIYNQFYSPSGRARFRERGAELLWIDIGYFDTADKQIAEQRVNTWQARWAGTANVIRAQGEARRLSSQEQGRVQVQTAMLRDIVKGLEDSGMPGDTSQSLRRLYLLRMAQLLEAMRAAPTNQQLLQKPANPPNNPPEGTPPTQSA